MKEYIVENLLESKLIHGKKYFKVKWMNNEETSWEPETSL